MRLDAGVDHQARVIFDTASTGTGIYAPSNYGALTEDGAAPTGSETALAGELSGEGLGRQQMTYAHTNGTNLVTLTNTWTKSSGNARTIRKAGLFYDASDANEISYITPVPDPPTLVTGDQVAVTWTHTL